MIRNRLYYQIIGIIEKNTVFVKTDFKIETRTALSKRDGVYIIYKHEPKYEFELQIPESSGDDGEYTFNGKVCPGVVAIHESFSVKGESNLFSGIVTWVNCIWEELATQPFLQSARKIEEQIDAVYAKYANPEQEYFTQQETEELKMCLEKLEKDFQEEIQDEVKDKKEVWKRIGGLSAEMDYLKSTITSSTRQAWLYSFYRTTYNLIG